MEKHAHLSSLNWVARYLDGIHTGTYLIKTQPPMCDSSSVPDIHYHQEKSVFLEYKTSTKSEQARQTRAILDFIVTFHQPSGAIVVKRWPIYSLIIIKKEQVRIRIIFITPC